jgi:hypothetical protein
MATNGEKTIDPAGSRVTINPRQGIDPHEAPGTLSLPGSAFLRIHSVNLDFNPRPRDESVTE